MERAGPRTQTSQNAGETVPGYKGAPTAAGRRLRNDPEPAWKQTKTMGQKRCSGAGSPRDKAVQGDGLWIPEVISKEQKIPKEN